MTLLLALVRRVPLMLEEQAKQNWSRLGVSAKATSIEGMTMVIVGYGQIGREVARRAKAFGVSTLAVSRSRKADEFADESFALSELDSVLARADIVMLTVALAPETKHLFDAERLKACKPGVLLINVARGGLVDQKALAEALVSGQVGGAGLDATTPEPLPAGDPLWAAPNLIISPHFAGGGSAVSQLRLAESAAGNLRRLISGEKLQHLVS
jgi:phosphoglycerate dehydrogenase-like enzyme